MVELSIVSGVGQPAPYAIVMLAESLRPQLGDPAVRARLDAELSKLLHDVNESLSKYERLKVLVVAPEPWSVENGCLTPTLKLKRSASRPLWPYRWTRGTRKKDQWSGPTT